MNAKPTDKKQYSGNHADRRDDGIVNDKWGRMNDPPRGTEGARHQIDPVFECGRHGY